MLQRSRILAAMAVSAGIAAGFTLLPALSISPAQAACEGERVNGTTADVAARKARAAGYEQMREWRKGCDSFWHATASKGGAQVNIVVTPSGEVMEEGS